ncbi:TRAP transporter small permease [Ornithinimicrobium flavum]|uniref:TRAP transporter small permease n=1 Tax=Ornithinimicrobium flavum TaxID=1288636 RepID=UPI00106F1ADB|nr:TRAP transporter small permease [Ornithinimicrobium flavum]
MNIVKSTLDQVLRWASVVLFAALVLIVVWQVVSRSLGSASTWSEEAARYTFVWLGFFASALVFSEKGHIAVDFLVRKQPPKGQLATAVLAQVSVLAMALLILVWGGLRASAGAWNQQLSSLPATVGGMYTVMPLTGAIIAFFAAYHLVELLQGKEPPYVLDEGVGGDVPERGEANL